MWPPAVLPLMATAFSVACAALPSHSNDLVESGSSSSSSSYDIQEGTTVSNVWYESPSPSPSPPPAKKNVPGAVGATVAAVLIVTIAFVIFMAHRGIWLRHLRSQQTKSKTVLSFRPTSTTPEPIEYDEDMRQQRSGQIVQSYISMETVCISDQESEIGVPVNHNSHDQYDDQFMPHTITIPLPVAQRP